MKTIESMKYAAVGAGFALIAGCSVSEESEPAPAPSATTIESARPTSEHPLLDAMEVEYLTTRDSNDQITQLQTAIGVAAVESLLMEPIDVMVDGKSLTVKMSIPEELEARSQTVMVAGNSEQAGALLAQTGFVDHANETNNVTLYSLKIGENGELSRTGPSVSVVGQENENAGPFRAIATERCQPLEMQGVSTIITDTDQYAGMKEAVCNSVGFAADVTLLGDTYEAYVKTYGGTTLGKDVDNGHEIEYPVLSRQQFEYLGTAEEN